MTILHFIKQLAHDLGGKITEIGGPLPDGSGFACMSLPLPDNHWSIQQSEAYEPPPMPFRMGVGPKRDEWAEKVRAAARYAYRSATMQGREPDLDPDALVQNFVVGLLGYWTVDGLSSTDEWANPVPIPPLHK